MSLLVFAWIPLTWLLFACNGIEPGAPLEGDATPVCDRGTLDVRLGQFHSCALSCDGMVRCWGDNSFGQLGLGDYDNRGDEPGEMGDALPIVDLGHSGRAIELSLGSSHSCALLDDGSVKCWGENSAGQLGLGDRDNRGGEPNHMGAMLPIVDLAASATAIAAGGEHTCAVLQGGSVKCWGANYDGELGQGHTETRGAQPGELGQALATVDLGVGAVAVDVVAGEDHSCALLDDSRVKCWGYNGNGRLGLGDTEDRGDQPDEMGDALGVVELGKMRVQQIAANAGGSHSCALLEGGQVKCWGDNGFGVLGVGDVENRGDDPGELEDSLAMVELGGLRAVSIGAGSGTSCAVLEDQSARCCGYNGYAALGLGDTRHRGDTKESMGKNLPAIALGTEHHAVLIRPGGGNHTCALLNGGALKCWGGNGQGQLGLGHGETIGDSPDEMGDGLAPVRLSAARIHHQGTR
ncbi:MAG: hypothetical protein OXU20_12535 [Myxococcales bacterium]|nr:hypothetical protein [Myxococcales bacterium]